MNAYELADFIDKYCEDNTSKEAAVLLRQQADRIAELESGIVAIQYTCPNCQTHVELFNKTPQTKPLSDEEIWNWFKENTALTKKSALRISRAIEERHGIK